jgi:hypothetical protein
MKRLTVSLAWLGACFTLGWAGPAVRADDGDETLRGWLAKAELVVAGQIVSEPIGIIHETGVPNYICDFKIADVLKGDSSAVGTTASVNIVRFELAEKDKSPLVKKDAECILFLKNVSPDKPVWRTADAWFGVQQRSPALARSLKKLASEKWERPSGRDGQPVAPGRALPQPAEPFVIRCERAEDKITVAKEDFGQTLTVTSPRGIGRATITRRGDTWPNPLKFRFNLKALEGLTVDTGKGKPINTGHHDSDVVKREAGIEYVIPRDRLGDDVQTLKIQWVDYYR